MGISRANEMARLQALGLSENACRVIRHKGVSFDELVQLVRKNRTSELFCDERGLRVCCCHWEKRYFVRAEIEQKLAEAGYVDLAADRPYRSRIA